LTTSCGSAACHGRRRFLDASVAAGLNILVAEVYRPGTRRIPERLSCTLRRVGLARAQESFWRKVFLEAFEVSGEGWLPENPDRKMSGTLKVAHNGKTGVQLIGALVA
jgi:hypothetical protein